MNVAIAMYMCCLQNYCTCTLQVADSRGHTLFQKDDVTSGKFAFTTEDYDMFEACFHSTVVGEYTVCADYNITGGVLTLMSIMLHN